VNMPKRRSLSVALIGTKFMGRAHSNAWRQAPRFFDLPADIRMAAICGRDRAGTHRAAKILGWERAVTDWKAIMTDPLIDIVDICTPNDSHAEMAIGAARAGKAILCEKPLARDVAEARRMVDAVKRARVANMVCHNYRRVPAVALAKQMIDAGKMGRRIYHFRARYAQDWIADENFPLVWRLQSKVAGSGALGDIGAHIIDLARFLVGELAGVSAVSETFVKKRLTKNRQLARIDSPIRRKLVAARQHYRLRTFVRAHDCRLCESRYYSRTHPARFRRRIKDAARSGCHPTRATFVLAVIELS